MPLMNQRERVLDYMERHGSITSLEAVNDLGVMELPRRICDLNKERIMVRNRFGEYIPVMRYSIVKED